ncbi:MAG: hypothetical protein NC356_01820 [Ruminococcus sp.]|nr:hypothetical protein [Ruminococcus sp.]
MWLTSSSVGRKFIMALTGAALVLFVTFHCLMNSVAIFWPTAYNAVCEFLGANWYALIASAGLALLIFIHIIYACWLTVMNRKARGNVRYSVEVRPKTVEWSSKNMLVLGIVVVAFLCVHMYQFWAKMQLVEVLGCEGEFPAAAGTLFLQEAFSCWVTPVCYAIGFIALWFHLNHGFWSMFQSVGWDNTTWIPRLKCIGKCWVGIVMVLFFIQIGVFTFNANRKYYLTDEALRGQYQEMIINSLTKHADASMKPMIEQLANADFKTASEQVRVTAAQGGIVFGVYETPEYQNAIKGVAELQTEYANMKEFIPALESAAKTFEALDPASDELKAQIESINNQKEVIKDQIMQGVEQLKYRQQMQGEMPY